MGKIPIPQVPLASIHRDSGASRGATFKILMLLQSSGDIALQLMMALSRLAVGFTRCAQFGLQAVDGQS